MEILLLKYKILLYIVFPLLLIITFFLHRSSKKKFYIYIFTILSVLQLDAINTVITFSSAINIAKSKKNYKSAYGVRVQKKVVSKQQGMRIVFGSDTLYLLRITPYFDIKNHIVLDRFNIKNYFLSHFYSSYSVYLTREKGSKKDVSNVLNALPICFEDYLGNELLIYKTGKTVKVFVKSKKNIGKEKLLTWQSEVNLELKKVGLKSDFSLFLQNRDDSLKCEKINFLIIDDDMSLYGGLDTSNPFYLVLNKL